MSAVTASGNNGDLVFNGYNGGANYPERLRITAAGNVGIGTTSANAKLHVKTGTNQNFYVSGPSLLASGISIASVNDAATANAPLEIRGAEVKVNALASNPITFNTDTSGDGGTSSERARIDSSGRLLVGTSSTSQSLTAAFQGVSGSSTAGAVLALSRGLPASSIDAQGYLLGRVTFTDNSQTPYAQIEGISDAAAGTNDYPGRIVLSTTADGASSPTERLRINQAGHLLLDHANVREQGSASNFSQFGNNTTAYPNIEFYAKNTSYASSIQQNICARGADSAYNFLIFYSGNAADVETVFRGNGNNACDGSWTGGGADYAEYFEWSDSNPDEEDRRGLSVVLDGDKIREAVAGEDPIGVISGNPSVVGDAAWNKWSGKYLRDEFGTYILEDYEAEDEDGNTVIQQRRKLNPSYDPNQEYISREQRPEWDCVGLMGKLRIRKGQVTGSRWIKMRDISDSVEEWLVR